MSDAYLNIPYTKSYRALFEAIGEICLLILPVTLTLFSSKNLDIILVLLVTLPCSWAMIMPLLEIHFLFSKVPILRLTHTGIHFYYPFQIGSVPWTAFEKIDTQKIKIKTYYCFQFQNTTQTKAHLSILKRLLFLRVYRKHGLAIPQSKLALTQQDFYQAIQDFSGVEPDETP